MSSDLRHFITHTCFWRYSSFVTNRSGLVKSSPPSPIHTSSFETLLCLPLTWLGSETWNTETRGEKKGESKLKVRIENFDQDKMQSRWTRESGWKEPIAAGCEGVRAFLLRLAYLPALLPAVDLCCEGNGKGRSHHPSVAGLHVWQWLLLPLLALLAPATEQCQAYERFQPYKTT